METATPEVAGELDRNREGRLTDQDSGAILLAIAEDLARELDPERQPRRSDLAASLDRDWGFDSLSRAELLLRIERRLTVNLPERLLGEATTLQDILSALPTAARVTAPAGHARPLPAAPQVFDPAPETVETLTEALDWHGERHGDRRHILIEADDADEISLTYAELAQQARAVASGLRQAGVAPGDRVAIMLPTGTDFFVAFYGALYAGAAATPIYPPARPSQIREHMQRQAGILRNAGAVHLIADATTRPLARLLRAQVPDLKGIGTVAGLSRGGDGTLPLIAAADVALLQYTSGSTGDPKGVVLTHANLLANIRAMAAALRPTASDVFVSWLPLYHDMGLIGAWLGTLVYGVPLVVMSPLRFLVRPERWLWAIHRHRGTLSAAPNFAFELCCRKIDDAAIEGLDISSLRMVANGAEPVSAETIRRFTERFARYGFRPEAMAPVYGLAENAVGLAFPPLGRRPVIERIDRAALSRRARAEPAPPDATDALELVACGRPLAGHQIRILGPTGEVAEREEGRLQFRGPSATTGYFRNTEKSRELFDGPWLDSGDLAYAAAGDIFITGRSKDIIIRAGQHIYPQEVEAVVGEVTGIRRGCVAVLGTTDPKSGTERLVVVAETRERRTAELDALRRRVGDAAAGLLQAPPEEILLVPPHAVPKTSSGKIRRTAARQLYERHGFGKPPALPWLQLAAFALAGLPPRLRELRRTLLGYAYAGYWWAIVGALGATAWPLALALPSQRARWAALHRLARAGLTLLRLPLAVRREADMPARAILVANHASYVDGLVLAAALPGELAFVAKHELAPQRTAGPFLRALGTLFVQRDDPAAAIEGERAVLDAVKAGQRVVIFPEGTLDRAPGLLPFHLGAFTIAASTGVPVLPIAIRGTRSVLRGGQWLPRRGPIVVTIGAPIASEGADFDAAVRLRDAARAAILAACGEPEAVRK